MFPVFSNAGTGNREQFDRKDEYRQDQCHGLCIQNINLSYERAFNQWFSVNIGFGTMPEGKVPFINAFLKIKMKKDLKI
jgi:hypothetical protein